MSGRSLALLVGSWLLPGCGGLRICFFWEECGTWDEPRDSWGWWDSWRWDSDAGWGDPLVEVSPSAVDFGFVSPGGTSIETITIRSVGNGDLVLHDIEIEDDAEDVFAVVSSPGSVVIGAGLEANFDIGFSIPQTWRGPEELSAVLVIETDDPFNPDATVSLEGRTEAERPLDANALDFGKVQAGCEASGDVEIRNMGDDTIMLVDATVQGAAELTGGLVETVEIGPAEQVGIDVTYAPLGEGAHEAVLRLGYVIDSTWHEDDVDIQGYGEAKGGIRTEDWADLTEPTDTFVLSAPPLAPSIVVRVDTKKVAKGWTFDDFLNAVVFDKVTVPGKGQDVSIDYIADACPDDDK